MHEIEQDNNLLKDQISLTLQKTLDNSLIQQQSEKQIKELMTKNYNLSMSLKESQYDLVTQQTQCMSSQKGGFSSMYNLQSFMRQESKRDTMR